MVCRKCSRKLDGGFGANGKKQLAQGLRRVLAGKVKGRKAASAVIEVDCLDVCPKNAVMVVRAKNPSHWAVVPKGMPVETVIERLGIVGPKS